MNKNNLSIVSQTDIGIYVWQTADGRFVADQDGNLMNIPGKRGDLYAMNELKKAARYYGIEDGEPYFVEGSRRITQEEWEHQKDRMLNGLVPDEYDIGAYKDEIELNKWKT